MEKCIVCGNDLPVSTYKPRKFCSDRCRKRYERVNGQAVNGQAVNGQAVNGQEKEQIVSEQVKPNKISLEAKEIMNKMAKDDNISTAELIEKLLYNEYERRDTRKGWEAMDAVL